MSSAVEPASQASANHREASLLRRLLLYGATRGLSEGLLSVRGLVLATVLSPSTFGAWALFRLGGRYAAIAELGVRRGLEFRVAQASGQRGAPGAAESVRLGRTALGYTLLVFGSIAGLFLIASFVVRQPDARFALRVLSAAVVVERLWFYGLTYLRSTKSLRTFAQLEVWSAFLHVALTAAMAVAWGLRGALLGFLIAGSVSLLSLARHAPFVPALSIGALRQLLGVGLPIAITALSSTVLVSVDRLVVAAVGGTALLGQYALAAAIASLAATLALVVRTVVYPDVYRRSSEGGAGAAVQELISGTILPFAFLYPPLLGLAALGIGPAVSLFFPQYLQAVEPARLFIFVGAASGFSGLGSLGAVASARQNILPVLSFGGLFLNLLLSAGALWAGLGLEGVAAGALVSRCAYGAAILVLNLRATGTPAAGRFVARAFLPLAYCAVLVYGLGQAFSTRGWMDALASAGVYCLLLLPLAPLLARQLGAVRARIA